MSFFDDLPPPPPPPERVPVEPPPWFGAPSGWVGGWVPWHFVLARSENVYIALSEVYAFPTGVEFTMSWRVGPAEPEDSGFVEMRSIAVGHGADMPRLGVAVASGIKATVGSPEAPLRWEDKPPPLMLRNRGGGGNDRERHQDLWLWPLPPPGPLRFVIAWPTHGVAETATVANGNELRAASEQAEQLWTDE